MDTPLRSYPNSGASPASGSRQRSAILGSITVQGKPEEVSSARGFIASTISGAGSAAAVDEETATLLTSELVTNAIQHTASGEPGGKVTVVAVGLPDGVLVEVIDDGSPGIPLVKNDLLAADGHGLHIVRELAAQWGYLRHAESGTTVWFHLTAMTRTAP